MSGGDLRLEGRREGELSGSRKRQKYKRSGQRPSGFQANASGNRRTRDGRAMDGRSEVTNTASGGDQALAPDGVRPRCVERQKLDVPEDGPKA